MPTIGPTPEAMRHGDYVQGNSGNRAVITNRRSNRLGELHGYGIISAREMAAGLRFEETYTIVWGSASNRDPLDMGPRGGQVHETEGAAIRWAHANARTNTILNRVGPQAYSMLVSVCVFGEALGEGKTKAGAERRDVFKAALRECATAYGIEDDA
jgi:hypothetical protein